MLHRSATSLHSACFNIVFAAQRITCNAGEVWDKNVPLIKPVFFFAYVTDSAVEPPATQGIRKESVKQAAACPSFSPALLVKPHWVGGMFISVLL